MQKCLKPEEIINFQSGFINFGDKLAARVLIQKKNEEDPNDLANPFRRRMSAGGRNRERPPAPDNERIRLELLTLNYPIELVDLALETNRFGETG
jgi:hypothetical protein